MSARLTGPSHGPLPGQATQFIIVLTWTSRNQKGERGRWRMRLVGLAGCGEQYPWSSARAHLSGRDAAGLVDFASWREVRGRGDWGDVLRGTALENECRCLRQATYSGLPLGETEFVQDLEKDAGRRLTPGRVGRPPQQRAAGA